MQIYDIFFNDNALPIDSYSPSCLLKDRKGYS